MMEQEEVLSLLTTYLQRSERQIEMIPVENLHPVIAEAYEVIWLQRVQGDLVERQGLFIQLENDRKFFIEDGSNSVTVR